MMSKSHQYAQFIKTEAKRLGFLGCGISRAEFLEQEAPRLEAWLDKNYHGDMAYMANHFDKRLDPRKLVEETKSVVSVLLNYYPAEQQHLESYKISKYAYGQDYHFVIKTKLKELMHSIQQEIGNVQGRAFVDSAPVMDKAWAAKAGLGWIGKHSNLLTKEVGSFYFIGELLLDLDLEPDRPTTNHCGTCTACIDACPTNAIVEPYVVDGSKCISYFTIELKDQIPAGYAQHFEDWMFGCDICQDVCPWNRFSKSHNEPLFQPHPDLISYQKSDWEEITQEVFDEIFKKSAVKRTKFAGLKRNIGYLKSGKTKE